VCDFAAEHNKKRKCSQCSRAEVEFNGPTIYYERWQAREKQESKAQDQQIKEYEALEAQGTRPTGPKPRPYVKRTGKQVAKTKPASQLETQQPDIDVDGATESGDEEEQGAYDDRG
jgi:hypothetical protein